MVAAIAIEPVSGDVISPVSACRVSVSGADSHDATTYNATPDPQDPPWAHAPRTMDVIPYRLIASLSGTDSLVSHEFVVSADGDHVWDNVIFPVDGAWTVDLVDQRDDSVAATAAVTVTA